MSRNHTTMTEQTTITSEEATVYCARHPKVETALTCASCGTPICPQCMVVSPVGMKCRECGTNRGGVLFQIGIGRLALASAVAFVAGVVAALGSSIGWFIVIFFAAPYGYFAGSLILKASGMKRGRKLEIAAGIFMVLGALCVKGFPLLHGGSVVALIGSAFGVISWVAIAVATACAVSKIRYM